MAKRQIGVALSKMTRRNEQAWRQRFDRHFPRKALVKLHAVLDLDAAHTRLDEVHHWEAAASICQRHNDPVELERVNQGAESIQAAADNQLAKWKIVAVVGIFRHADYAVRAARPGRNLLQQL